MKPNLSAGAAGKPVGLWKEKALGMYHLGTQLLQKGRPVLVAHGRVDDLIGMQGLQEIAVIPSLDDGE